MGIDRRNIMMVIMCTDGRTDGFTCGKLEQPGRYLSLYGQTMDMMRHERRMKTGWNRKDDPGIGFSSTGFCHFVCKVSFLRFS